MKRWRRVRDGEIKTKSSVCLLLHAHTLGRRSRHSLQLVIGLLFQLWKKDIDKLVVFFILVPVLV